MSYETRGVPLHDAARRHLQGRLLRGRTCPPTPAERDDLLLRLMGSRTPVRSTGSAVRTR